MSGKKTRLIDANALIAPLREEYEKVKQAFDETSVFQAPNDVALYGALMQELGAVIGMIEDAKTIVAEPVKHGKWIYKIGKRICCSECGVHMPWKYVPYYGYADWISNYCPQCGAMVDETDEQERRENCDN